MGGAEPRSGWRWATLAAGPGRPGSASDSEARATNFASDSESGPGRIGLAAAALAGQRRSQSTLQLNLQFLA